MKFRTFKQYLKFLTLSLILAACAKQENLEIAKKNFTLGEDQLAPVYKKNNVPADLQDSYIVVFNDDVPESEIDGESEKMCGSANAKKERTFKHALKGFSGRLSATAIEEFRKNPKVKYIEQDQIMSAVVDQTPATWGLDRINQPNLPLDNKYSYTTNGSTVDVYIFDTGIKLDHVEFTGRIVLPGFDAFSLTNNGNDLNGHGTHVAGTVAGTIYGVAKGAKLIPVRVLDALGSGSITGVIAGLDWAVQNHTTNRAVGNMSLGGGFSQGINDAVVRCINDGIVMAVAAGNNSGADASLYSPASTPQAITVGSSTNTDARSTFSNVGSVVDIFAPGESITSAWHTSVSATRTISGTSMASPHVAGAAALYLEYVPGSTQAQVETALKQFAALGRITGLPNGTSNNLLQINFGTVPPLPTLGVPTLSSPANAATNVSVAPTLSWVAATAATGYNLEYSTSSTFNANETTTITGITTTSRTLSGLANSRTYYWRVSSTNSTTTSAPSAVRSFTTVAPLAIPVAPTLSAPANAATNVTRTPTMSWNAVTGAATYDIEISTTNTFASVTFGRTGLTARSIRVSQLGSRTAYFWRVRAVNAAGTGPWSAIRSFTTRQ
jgi:subtilisin family serine protease